MAPVYYLRLYIEIALLCLFGLSTCSNGQFLSNILGIRRVSQDIGLLKRDFGIETRLSQDVCVHDVPTPINFDESNGFVRCFEKSTRSKGSRHPDQDLRVNGVLRKYGYFVETYDNVTTQDGYILTVFRISGSPSSPPRKGKPAVLLYHGMGTAADIWVLQNDVNKNLATKLVNDGKDVFLVNSRGTDFSRRHVKWNPDTDIQYWDFSYHEFGTLDFPTVLNLILEKTGNSQLIFICHSMGCNVLGVALSEQPELNEKIKASIMLAPAFYIGHTYSPLRALSVVMEMGPYAQGLLNLAVRGRIDSGTPLMNLIQSSFCTPTALRCSVCGLGLSYIYGYDAPQMNYTNIPNVVSKLSNTQSFKTLLHLGQNFRNCQFRKYDYGKAYNLRKYGQADPPSYKLGNIKVPSYIYYADADNFVPPVDIIAARNALPPETVKTLTKVKWKLFNHIDFMLAASADVLVYNNVISTINKLSRKVDRDQ